MTRAKDISRLITDADFGGTLTVGDITASSLNGGQFGGRRNIIINGAMQISQRIGTTATALTGGNYGLDRWGMYSDGNSYTTQQVVDAPDGFYNSMKLTVTGTTTPNYSFFGQRIEGLNVNHIGLGTANCQSFTLSFYVKSSVTGVYSISMTNGVGDLGYPVQYTINSANTWERKSMTIAPITSGTWVTDSTNGLYLRVNMGSPSSRTATANGWRSGNFDGADGSTGGVTWATTSGATWYITGVQLEVGSVATLFEHRSFGEELALCQRYYHEQGNYPESPNSGYEGFCVTAAYNAGGARGVIHLPTKMRTTPALSTIGSFELLGAATVAVTAITLADGGGNPAVGINAASSGLTASQAHELRSSNDQAARIQFDAEL